MYALGMNVETLIKHQSEAGIKHWSFSAANQSAAKWVFNYVHRSAEDRQADILGWNVELGKQVHHAIQNVLAHGLDLEQAIEEAVSRFMQYPLCEDIVKRDKFCEVMPSMITQAVDLLNQWAFTGCEAETKISCEFPGVNLPVIGFVDLLREGMFTEIKTRAPVKSRILKSGEQGWAKGRIPKDEPEKSHVMQAALYAYATKLTPSICYVSAEGSHIFTPLNCETLQTGHLDRALEDLRQKVLIKQNLLSISSDSKVLASITDPDWQHNYQWDIEPELFLEAKRLWQI